MINEAILHYFHKEGFEEQELYEVYKIFFSTLVSEPRLKIINLLRKGKKNVSEIMKRLNMRNLSKLMTCTKKQILKPFGIILFSFQ